MTAPKLLFTPSLPALAAPTGAKAQNAEWLAADIDYANENSWPSDKRAKFKISLAVSAAVVIEVTRDSGATWTKLNAGNALTADCDYMFDVQIAKTDKFNMRTPTAGGCTIRYCYIDAVLGEG